MTAYHPLTPAAGIAGVDEAGRGPLAGPLVVASVVLHPRRCPPGLDDSKRLSERRRNDLFERIREQALAFHVECIAPAEIDRLNIYQATLHGMRRSLHALAETPTLALIDGNVVPPALPCAARAIVKGDALEPAISAASILAKVTRDRLMRELHAQYPGYGFDRHMGYPTPEHLQRLREIGASDCHRRSFAPVREALQRGPEQALLSI